jgi:TPR repeat protein
MTGHDGAKKAGGLGKTARAALFYLAAAAMGVALYKIGHMYATGQRGYVAYGGELLLLLLPLYACAARQAARELAKDWKEVRGLWRESNTPK